MYGERLRELRKRYNLSRQNLVDNLSERYGDEFQLSQDAIAKYESEAREPTTATFIRLCDYFGVTMDYLLGIDNKSGTQLDDVQRKLALLDDQELKRVDDFVEYLRWQRNQQH